jgi:hypothetical protein
MGALLQPANGSAFGFAKNQFRFGAALPSADVVRMEERSDRVDTSDFNFATLKKSVESLICIYSRLNPLPKIISWQFQ